MKFLLCLILSMSLTNSQAVTDRSPVVGIVLLHTYRTKFPRGTMFVLTCLSKWLAQAGIRWIPLYMDAAERDTDARLAKVDGLFFTGGAEDLYAT